MSYETSMSSDHFSVYNGDYLLKWRPRRSLNVNYDLKVKLSFKSPFLFIFYLVSYFLINRRYHVPTVPGAQLKKIKSELTYSNCFGHETRKRNIFFLALAYFSLGKGKGR